MQARTLKIIAALLIISAIVMGVIGYKISQQDSHRATTVQSLPTASGPDISYAQKLLVVNQPLAKGTVLTSEHLEVVPFPIPVEDAFSNPKDILNKKLELAVRKGEVLRSGHFVKRSPLTAEIKDGHRAVAVNVNEVIGTGGFLAPGDYVDVIYTARASKENYQKSLSRRILRNIRLLAYGADIGEALPTPEAENAQARSPESKDTGKRSRSAVLEIPEVDVNILTLAEDSGTLRLVAVGDAELELARNAEADAGESTDDATFIRSVTGIKPPAPPKSVYVYSGDQVETVRVPK